MLQTFLSLFLLYNTEVVVLKNSSKKLQKSWNNLRVSIWGQHFWENYPYYTSCFPKSALIYSNLSVLFLYFYVTTALVVFCKVLSFSTLEVLQSLCWINHFDNYLMFCLLYKQMMSALFMKGTIWIYWQYHKKKSCYAKQWPVWTY